MHCFGACFISNGCKVAYFTRIWNHKIALYLLLAYLGPVLRFFLCLFVFNFVFNKVLSAPWLLHHSSLNSEHHEWANRQLPECDTSRWLDDWLGWWRSPGWNSPKNVLPRHGRTRPSLLVPFREWPLEFAHASVVVCLLEILCEAKSIQHLWSNIIVRASVCCAFQ